MKIYIDEENKCHVSNDGTMQEIETAVFDGKCTEYIEGFCFEPVGETSGVLSPWKPYHELERAQLEYDLAQLKAELADADAALNELGVNVDGL
jgi:hypothetical protein